MNEKKANVSRCQFQEILCVCVWFFASCFIQYSNGKSLLATPENSTSRKTTAHTWNLDFCIGFRNKQICFCWYFLLLVHFQPSRCPRDCNFPDFPLSSVSSSTSRINKTFVCFYFRLSVFVGNFYGIACCENKIYGTKHTETHRTDGSHSLHKKSSVI